MNLSCPKCGAPIAITNSDDPSQQVECLTCHQSMSIANVVGAANSSGGDSQSPEEPPDVDEPLELELDDLDLSDDLESQQAESAAPAASSPPAQQTELDDFSFAELLSDSDAAAAADEARPRSRDEKEIEWLTEDATTDDTELDVEDTLVDGAEGSPSVAEAPPAHEESSLSTRSDDHAVSDDDFQLELDELDTSPAATDLDEHGLATDAEPVLTAEHELPASDSQAVPADEQHATASDDATSASTATAEPTKPFQMETMELAPTVPQKRTTLQLVMRALTFAAAGLLGVIVIQLALWWALGQDPLGLALLLPDTVAFVAPQKLRPPSFPPVRPPVMPEADDGDTNDLVASQDEETGDELVAENQDERAEQLTETAAAEDAADLAVLDERPSEDPADAESADVLDEGTTGEDLASDDMAADFAPEAAVATSDAPRRGDRFADYGPQNAASFTANDVAVALDEARRAIADLDAASPTDRSALITAARGFYIAMADLAEVATLANRAESGASREAVRQIMREIAADQQKLVLVGNSARGWIRNHRGTGILLAGTMQRVLQLGELHELQLVLLGREATPVAIVTRWDEQEALPAPGSRILAMGVIVQNAADALPDYTGDQPQVLWATDLIVGAD